MSNNRTNLMNAILEVRKATGAVLKAGRNAFHNYSYATANDILNEVREAMNQHGLITYPIEQKDISYHKDGTVEEYSQLYEVCHAGSGECITMSIRCAGEDKGDKRAYKANTGALKYLFIQLFLLPTNDDPENDAKDKKAPAQQQAPAPSGGTAPAPDAATKPWLNEDTDEWKKAVDFLTKGGKIEKILAKYKISKKSMAILEPIIKKAEADKAAAAKAEEVAA